MLLPFRDQIQIWSQCHGQGRRPAPPATVVVGGNRRTRQTPGAEDLHTPIQEFLPKTSVGFSEFGL